MISFTDPRLYVKGTCSAILSDKATGDIKYYSDKFQTGNITTTLTTGEIRAGLGNGIAAIIPSDSAMNVEFAAADFSLWAKAAQVGGTLNYNAPSMTCQVITATTAALTVDTDKGTPVAQLGFSEVFGYVQEVGEASPISSHGISYPIDPVTGTVKGFTAVSGKQYKVWYCVNKATAQVATISSFFDPAVYHFTAQMAVYANVSSGEKNSGTRVGWLYVIVPSLKLGGKADVVGDQTTNDTTSISGQAVISDADTISATCDGCGGGNTYAYYVYVPDSGSASIAGLAVVGGVVTVKASSSVQIPVRFVMENGQLVEPNYSDLTYALDAPPSGTSISNNGVLTAGATAGDAEGTASYTKDGANLSVVFNVSVTTGS